MSIFDDPVSLRLHLYLILLVFSVILLGLTAGRLGYTLNLPKGDPLNGGRDFYDPSVAELLFVSILLVLASSLFAWIIRTGRESRFITRLFVEVPVLIVLWFLLIVGTGIATNIWPNLNFCIQFTACEILQAMLAFAWLCWLLLSALIVISIMYAGRNSRWHHHIHSWDHNWLERKEIEREQMRDSGIGDMEAATGHAFETREVEEEE